MMAAQLQHRPLFPRSLWFLSVFICALPWFLSAPCRAQVMRDREVAVNLTEGRVVVCATKDAIVLAALESRAEPDARPPEITILSAIRMGVMMGATEWMFPESNDKPIQ